MSAVIDRHYSGKSEIAEQRAANEGECSLLTSNGQNYDIAAYRETRVWQLLRIERKTFSKTFERKFP